MPGYWNAHSDRDWEEQDEEPWDDEEDREADCGRWNNGRLMTQCRLAGTEWCDWECPIGLGRNPW